jgi:hypothetical protein
MQSFSNLYSDWKEYFKAKITSSESFYLSGQRKDGKIEVEIYTSTIPGFKTSVEVGYTSPQYILFLRILNPFTPALNKRQREYFFDQNDFYPHFNQKEIGLEFDNFNIQGIDEYLSYGLKGSETVYLLNGKPAKSILNSDSLPRTDATLTYYFEKALPRHNANEEEGYDQAIEIDLHEIYPGTNRS